MRKSLRYALSPILAATWLVATLSFETAKAEPRDQIRQAYSLAERLDWDRCTALGRRAVEQSKQLLDQLAELYKQASLSGDFRLASDINDAGEELADALDYYYADCGPGITLGGSYFYIPGTDTAIQIGGYVRTAIEFSGEFGQLNRPNFGSALQLETGGSLINSASITRSAAISGFTATQRSGSSTTKRP